MNQLKTIQQEATVARISHQIKHAQDLYKNGEYHKSLKITQQIYTKIPSNVDVLILLSSIQFQMRNLSMSIFYAQQTIRVSESNSDAYSIMGNCLKEMNDLSSAINFFNKAIRINPRFACAYNNLGLALFMSGKSQEALNAFDIAVSLDTSHTDALCNIGTVSKILGRNNFAKEKYLEAIRIQPACAIAWSNLGGIFVGSGDYQQAVDCYKHALHISPNFVDALHNSCNAMFQLEMEKNKGRCAKSVVDEIAERYEEVLKLKPDFALARANYSLFCYKMGLKTPEDTMRQLRIAIREDKNEVCFDAMNNLAALYYEDSYLIKGSRSTLAQTRLNDSLKLFIRALKRKPQHWCALNNVGNVLKGKVSMMRYLRLQNRTYIIIA